MGKTRQRGSTCQYQVHTQSSLITILYIFTMLFYFMNFTLSSTSTIVLYIYQAAVCQPLLKLYLI